MTENKYRCPACRVSFRTPNPLPINKGIRCAKCQAVFKLNAEGVAELKTPAPLQTETALEATASVPAAVETAISEEPWSEPEAPVKAERPARKNDRRDDRDRDQGRDREEPRRRGKEAPARSKSGGGAMVLILVAVGVGGLVLLTGGCVLVSVLWLFAPGSPVPPSQPRDTVQLKPLETALPGRWSTGLEGQQTIYEFLPEGRFVLHQPNAAFAVGSWKTLNEKEIEIVQWVGNDPTVTTTVRREVNIQGVTLALTDAEQSKVETLHFLSELPPLIPEKLEGVWIGDETTAKGIELTFEAGQQMREAKDGKVRAGKWQLWGGYTMERDFGMSPRPEYVQVFLNEDGETLTLTLPDGSGQKYKRKVNP